MAKTIRSSILAIIEETTEGTLVAPASANNYTTLRAGFKFEGAVNFIATDELLADIGEAEGFVGKQQPTGSVAKYLKHSGTEGTAPDYGELLKCSLGQVTAHGTEKATSTGSTAGTASAAPVINMAAGAGATLEVGCALMIKDPVNGNSIRNITAISTDALTLNFNLAGAPATGVNTGKPVHYSTLATGWPTFSAHVYQSNTASAVHQAMTGCRTTNISMDFTANALGTATFAFDGIAFYRNPLLVTTATSHLDFNIDGSTNLPVVVPVQAWSDPMALATELTTRMTALAGVAITCTFSNSTGKFTISKASGTLNLSWNTGANTANTIAALLGFSSAADSTGAVTYTSATALSYDSPYTPTYDSSKANVVRYNELVIGDFTRNDVRKASKVAFTIATPKTDVMDLTAQTGVSGSILSKRTVTMTATLILQQHEVLDFDAMLANNAVSVMFNHGQKSGSNWVPGQCVNICMPQCKISKSVIADSSDIVVVEIEAKAFVTSSQKDIHINFV